MTRLPTENVKDDEYRKQAQITELNALNAAMAVIRFKQHFEIFDRQDESSWHIFEIIAESSRKSTLGRVEEFGALAS